MVLQYLVALFCFVLFCLLLLMARAAQWYGACVYHLLFSPPRKGKFCLSLYFQVVSAFPVKITDIDSFHSLFFPFSHRHLSILSTISPSWDFSISRLTHTSSLILFTPRTANMFLNMFLSAALTPDFSCSRHTSVSLPYRKVTTRIPSCILLAAFMPSFLY